VTDSSGQRATATRQLTVTADEPPTAAFTTATAVPVPMQPVGFDASRSADPDGAITAYAWSFGDGATATGSVASHAYTSPGTYTVTLTVTDTSGHSAATTTPVTVHALPQPLLRFSPALPLAGSPATFDASGSIDPDTSISSYQWSFGDGAGAGGSAPTHTYASPGTYTVALTVTNALGLTTVTSRQVTVADGHPAAAIAVVTPQPTPGQPVSFTAAAATGATGATVTYLWRFGDGSTAAGRAPTHTYARPGRYIVSLTVTDSSGATTVTHQTVVVQRRGPITKVAVQRGATLRVSVDTAGTLTVGRHMIRLTHAGAATIRLGLTPAQRRAIQRGRLVKIRLRFAPRGRAAVTRTAILRAAASGHMTATLGR
jgi:PKD repeat protein